MQLTFRTATQADFDLLWKLHQETMHEYVDATYGWNDHAQLEYFKNGYRPESLTLVEWNDQLAGCYCLEQRESCLYLASMEIAPEFQNKGIGSRYLAQFMAIARDHCVPLELHVMKANLAARRLYERVGFQVVGEISKYGTTPTHDHMRWTPKRDP